MLFNVKQLNISPFFTAPTSRPAILPVPQIQFHARRTKPTELHACRTQHSVQPTFNQTDRCPTVNRIHNQPAEANPSTRLSSSVLRIPPSKVVKPAEHLHSTSRMQLPEQHREAFLQDHSPLPDIHRSSLHQEAQSAYVSAGDRYLRTAVRQFINHTKFVRYHRISHLVIDILLYNFRNHKI